MTYLLCIDLDISQPMLGDSSVRNVLGRLAVLQIAYKCLVQWLARFVVDLAFVPKRHRFKSYGTQVLDILCSCEPFGWSGAISDTLDVSVLSSLSLHVARI